MEMRKDMIFFLAWHASPKVRFSNTIVFSEDSMSHKKFRKLGKLLR